MSENEAAGGLGDHTVSICIPSFQTDGFAVTDAGLAQLGDVVEVALGEQLEHLRGRPDLVQVQIDGGPWMSLPSVADNPFGLDKPRLNETGDVQSPPRADRQPATEPGVLGTLRRAADLLTVVAEAYELCLGAVWGEGE